MAEHRLKDIVVRQKVLFADAAEARASHDAGVVRLIVLALGREWKTLTRSCLWPRSVLQLLHESEMSASDLSDEIARAAVHHAYLADKPTVRDAAAFLQRLDSCHTALGTAQADLSRRIGAILHEAAAISALLTRAAGLLPAVRNDMSSQLAWLIFPGFVVSVPWPWLEHYPRYLEAMRMRAGRARLNPAGDARKLAEFEPVWQRYEDFAALEKKPPHDRAALQEYRWLLEEFRISLFAQELRTAVPVSAKRLDALWGKAMGL